MIEAKVIVQRATQQIDSCGRVESVFNDVCILKGVMLPLENDISKAKEGLREEIKYQFFYKGKSRDIKKYDKFIYKGIELYVVDLLDYGKALDIKLADEVSR